MSSWKYWVTGKMNLMNLEKNSKHQTMQYFSWKQFFTKTDQYKAAIFLYYIGGWIVELKGRTCRFRVRKNLKKLSWKSIW